MMRITPLRRRIEDETLTTQSNHRSCLTEHISDLNTLWHSGNESGPSHEKLIRDVIKLHGHDRLLTLALDTTINSIFFKHRSYFGPFTNVEDWVLGFSSSAHGLILKPHLEEEDKEGTSFAVFMNTIRTEILGELRRIIGQAILVGRMPPKGIVLYFTEDLTAQFLVTYDARSGETRVDFVAKIEYPKALFNPEEINGLPSAHAKNTAKSFLHSGHKAIVHEGVVTHVDRRRHFEVFGPSIDTLYMGRLVADYVRKHEPGSVLEVGVGSGHILTVAIHKNPRTKYVDGIDVNPYSIICTNENLERIISTSPEIYSNLDRTLSIGEFSKDKFARQYDLIICNPPYISLPEKSSAHKGSDFERSVLGTELVQEVLQALPSLLSKSGKCLMMVSSATLDFETSIPRLLSAELANKDKIRVPFDIEAVNEDGDFLEYLIENDAVERDNKGELTHQLLPYWIEAKK